MSKKITEKEIQLALAAAGSAHHDYESHYLNGVRDEQWPGWYAAYALGRLGDFTSPSQLTEWLETAPSPGIWAEDVAKFVAHKLESEANARG